MARLNRSNLLTKINERFNDNTVGEITAARARAMFIDVIDSFVDFADSDIGAFYPYDTELYSDLDDVTKNGFYFLDGDEDNAPSATPGHLIVMGRSGDQVTMQLYFSFAGSECKIRKQEDGTWTAWVDFGDFQNHQRGTWNITDTLPANGSGVSGAIKKFDRWIVPSGGWAYLLNFFPQWSILEAMEDGATTFDQFKFPY